MMDIANAHGHSRLKYGMHQPVYRIMPLQQEANIISDSNDITYEKIVEAITRAEGILYTLDSAPSAIESSYKALTAMHWQINEYLEGRSIIIVIICADVDGFPNSARGSCQSGPSQG